MSENIGELVRRLRKERGWSSYRLAEESGLQRSSVWRVEQGLRSPEPETLAKLAEALETRLEDLYAAAGLSPPKSLPSFRPYLRAKYGHLPESKQRDLGDYFERIAREYEDPNNN